MTGGGKYGGRKEELMYEARNGLFFLQVSLIRSSYLLILIFITLFRSDFVYFMVKGDLSHFRTRLSVVLWISVSTSFGVRWFSRCLHNYGPDYIH